jgi:hypothetical protein
MLGQREPQRTFFGTIARLGNAALDRLGFYGQLARLGSGLFRDEDFAQCYCPKNGRPSTPPSILATARLLQHYEGVSDAEVIDRCRFDLRWKVALDLDLDSIEAPFAKSTFQGFRARLTLHAQEGLAFERSVREAKEKGLLPKQLTVALDSSPVRGRGALKDTFNLLSDAIAGVIRAVARKRGTKAEDVVAGTGLERHLDKGSIKGSEVVDWDNSDQVNDFLGRILDECQQAVQLAEDEKCATAEVELLKKVVDQDTEKTETGARIKQGVAKDRTVSASDPEMRHGHKSSGKAYNGHKAHVAVDVDTGVVTGIDIGAPGEADGSQVKNLIDQTRKTTGSEVAEALGDAAYGSRTGTQQANECGVELKTKMPSPPRGRFAPADFDVSDDGSEARCPAGHCSVKVLSKDGGHLHLWSPDACGSCPFKDKCTKADRRTLLVAPDFHDRRRREREARSPEGRLHLRKRIPVEHAIGRLKNLGAGVARYFGRAKTKAQWMWTAAVMNLMILWRHTGEAAA